jgi:uncharacterized membrane protein YesL
MPGKNNRNNRSNRNNTGRNLLEKRVFSKLTGYGTEGKGVKKKKLTDKELYSIKGFFFVYKQQFWNLIILNLIFMLLISPAFCGLLSFSGFFHTREATPSNIMFAPVYGAQLASPTPAGINMMGIYGAQGAISLPNQVTEILSYVMLVVFLTFGPANAGLTYVVRAYTRREFVFMWGDFFRTIKKNFFGSILMGAADLGLMILLGFSSVYYYYAPGTSNTLLFLIMSGMCFIYLFMRFYIYILLITFKLSPFKLYKNAFILAILGIKRNIAGLLGIVALILLCMLLFMVSVPFGITLPFFFLASNCGFIACFAAWANIKKFMVDPFEEHKDGDKFDIKIDEGSVFVDQG